MARKPLSRDRVLEKAMNLADKQGIESLSMRRLARELGVEAMSLYNHVESKGDLVDAMVDLVIGEIELPSDAENWRAAIRKCAISAHEAYLRHPWASSLAYAPTATRGLRATRLAYMEWLLGRLRDAGFSAEFTYHAYHVLDGYIVGFTMWQLGHAAGAKALSDDEDFVQETVVGEWIPQLRAGGYSHLAEHAEQHLSPPNDGRTEFEFGLDLILDGLER